MKTQFALVFVLLTALFVGCSKDYFIQLPGNKSELVIECYLEDGQPLRALVSESTALLDTSTMPPILSNVLVIITHGNIIDTLKPSTYFDTLKRRIYNYSSAKIVSANYNSNVTYRIDVYDGRGRHAYGETYFLPLVQIDSLLPTFNNQQEAFCYTKFTDPNLNTPNYFRLLLHKNKKYDSLSLETLLDNNFANNNNEFIFGSGSDFKKGDTIFGTLYHLSPEYYQYLSTSQNARLALVNPFAVVWRGCIKYKRRFGCFCRFKRYQKTSCCALRLLVDWFAFFAKCLR